MIFIIIFLPILFRINAIFIKFAKVVAHLGSDRQILAPHPLSFPFFLG